MQFCACIFSIITVFFPILLRNKTISEEILFNDYYTQICKRSAYFVNMHQALIRQ